MSSQRRPPEERSLSARVRRRPLLVVLVALCLVFAASYTGRLAEYRRLQNEKAAVQAQIVKSQAKGRQLTADLAYVKSFEYIEKMAITELGMARKDEQVLTVIERAPASQSTAADTQRIDAENSSVDDVTGEPLTNRGPSIWRQWVSVFTPQQE